MQNLLVKVWVGNMINKINYVLYYLCEFIISLLIFALVFLFICDRTLLNPNYIIKELDRHDYYEYLDKEIRNEMDNYVVQAGLDSSVLDNIYSKKVIEETMNNYIIDFYKNNDLEIDSSSVKENLKINIDNYLDNKNIQAADSDSLEKFVKQMTDIYEDSFSISNIIDKMSSKIGKLSNIITTLIYISIFSLLIVVAFLKLYFKKNILTVPLFTSAFINLFIVYYIKFSIDLKNLVLLSSSKIINYVSIDIIDYIRNLSFLLIIFAIAIYIINVRISSRSLGDKNEFIK